MYAARRRLSSSSTATSTPSSSLASRSSSGVTGGMGSGAGMLRFYTDDAPGLRAKLKGLDRTEKELDEAKKKLKGFWEGHSDNRKEERDDRKVEDIKETPDTHAERWCVAARRRRSSPWRWRPRPRRCWAAWEGS